MDQQPQEQHGSYYQYYRAKWGALTSTEKLISVGASAYVGLAAAKTCLVGTLRCIGFSTVGPVAHSWAAAWESAVAGGDSRGYHSVGAALFSWAQHVAMTWHIFTPSAAVLGIIAAVYFSSGYIVHSARSVLRAGIFGGEEESRGTLLGSSEVEGPLMMEIDEEEAVSDNNAADLISLEEESV